MKTKLKEILYWIIWFIVWVTTITWFAFQEDIMWWIDLYFEKQNILEQMDELSYQNNWYRKELKTTTGAILKLNTTKTTLENKISSNSRLWSEYKWKLDLIDGFLKEDN